MQVGIITFDPPEFCIFRETEISMPTYTLPDLLDIMARLRAPDGCPWDRKQTHESLLNYLIEESYEYIDAVEAGDKANMREELGDVLLQVVFHAQLAKETGDFTFADVVRER